MTNTEDEGKPKMTDSMTDKAVEELAVPPRPRRKRSWLRVGLLCLGIGGVIFVGVAAATELLDRNYRSARAQPSRDFSGDISNYPDVGLRAAEAPIQSNSQVTWAEPAAPHDPIQTLAQNIQAYGAQTYEAQFNATPAQSSQDGLPSSSGYVQPTPYSNSTAASPYYSPAPAANFSAPASGLPPQPAQTEAERLVAGIQWPQPGGESKEALKQKLLAELEKEFVQRHQQQLQRLETMRVEVARLGEVLSERMSRKDDIVRQRMIELVGERDPLRWDYDVESDAQPTPSPSLGSLNLGLPLNTSSPLQASADSIGFGRQEALPNQSPERTRAQTLNQNSNVNQRREFIQRENLEQNSNLNPRQEISDQSFNQGQNRRIDVSRDAVRPSDRLLNAVTDRPNAVRNTQVREEPKRNDLQLNRISDEFLREASGDTTAQVRENLSGVQAEIRRLRERNAELEAKLLGNALEPASSSRSEPSTLSEPEISDLEPFLSEPSISSDLPASLPAEASPVSQEDIRAAGSDKDASSEASGTNAELPSREESESSSNEGDTAEPVLGFSSN